MPIPQPFTGEQRDEFISRCVSQITNEYSVNQAVAICSATFDESRKDYLEWKQFDDLSRTYENRYTPIFKKALMDGLSGVIDTANVDSISPELFNFEPLKESLKEAFQLVGVNFGIRTINQQKSYINYQFKAETDYRNILKEDMLLYFEGDYASILAQIDGNTDEIIRIVSSRVFQQAVEEGWGVAKLRRGLIAQFGSRMESRARTIARTELLRAASVGDNNGINRIAQETGKRVQSTWIPTFDNSARDFHMSMRVGTIVKGVQTYVSGEGNPLKYPRDAAAPASETVNCRCSESHRLI